MKKKWKFGATIKSRSEPHTIRQVNIFHLKTYIIKNTIKIKTGIDSMTGFHLLGYFQVFEILCGVREEEDQLALAEQIYTNTENLFFPKPDLIESASEKTEPGRVESKPEVKSQTPEVIA